MITLIAEDGRLCTPLDAVQDPDLKEFFSGNPAVIYHHPEGDHDSIPWPMLPEHKRMLASALYDDIECGTIPPDRTVILPDGTLFNIDEHCP